MIKTHSTKIPTASTERSEESGGIRMAQTSNSNFLELVVLSKKNAALVHALIFNKWVNLIDVAIIHDVQHVKYSCAVADVTFGPRNRIGQELLEYIVLQDEAERAETSTFRSRHGGRGVAKRCRKPGF